MSQNKNDQPIVVSVDPDLADLIPGFLEKRRKDATRVLTALERGDYKTIRNLGHDMKGMGSGYGFDAITEIGRSLEEAAKKQDAVTIQKHVADLSSYLDHVQITYDQG